MALIQCPECEKEVSEDAEVCPNWGCVLRKKHSVIGIIGFVIAIISWFGGVYFTFFLSTLLMILCIIGCLQNNKKHIFAIIGNVVLFMGILTFLIFLY